MAFAMNAGTRVFYRTSGAGTTLVLQHGMTNTHECWFDEGYVAALSPAHQVVCIDARGHGRTDKPHDPDAYHPSRLASDVTAVLDDLGVARAHFFGYSMGGWIGQAIANMHPSVFARW